MKKPTVLIIAMNQPLDNDAQIRRNMFSAESRAQRQADRFPGMDLPAIQKGVHRNLGDLYFSLNDRYMDLLDLMNFLKNRRKTPILTPGNINEYYSLANTISHNGIYLFQYLSQAGFEPILIQNYATVDLEDFLKEKPVAVCISSNFILMDEIKEMARTIKETAPQVNVIVGGMLVKKVLDAGQNLAPQAKKYLATFHGKVDQFIVESQGEQTLVRLLDALSGNSPVETVPNLALFDDTGTMVFTRRQREDIDMDETAIQWDRIPRRYLRSSLPVNSSRGCYYRCRFCTYHWLFPEVHYKSLEVLRDELRTIEALGFVRHVRFTDDNFTANRSRLQAVLRMIIEEGFRFTWSSFARASALTPELVSLMKESGCEFVDMGIESGSQIVLDNMDKKLKPKQSVAAIRMLVDHDIYARGSFIVGFPGETVDTFTETIDLIFESGLPYYHPYLFYYSPNTLIHQQREKFGLQGMGLAWKHKTMDAIEASHLMSQMVQKIPAAYTDGITYIEEIYKLLRGEGYSPRDIWKLFRFKRDLQLQTNGTAPGTSSLTALEETFHQIESVMK